MTSFVLKALLFSISWKGILAGILLFGGIGYCKIESCVEDKVIRKIERSNVKLQAKKTKTAKKKKKKAIKRTRDLDTCQGRECVDIIDSAFD